MDLCDALVGTLRVTIFFFVYSNVTHDKSPRYALCSALRAMLSPSVCVFSLSTDSFTDSSGGNMYRQHITGKAAGACAAFWIATGNQLLPTTVWGHYPLLLGMLPFIAGLLIGRPLIIRTAVTPFSKWLAAAVAMLAPVLFYVLYEMTSALSFVSGQADAISFIVPMLLFAALGGLTIDALTIHVDRTPDHAQLLTGGAIGFAILVAASNDLPLPMLLLVYLVPFVLLPTKFVTAGVRRSEPAPVKKARPARAPRLPDASDIALPILLTAGIFAAGIFFRAFSEMPFVTSFAVMLHTGILFLAIGQGINVGRMLSSRLDDVLKALLPALAAAVLLAGSWLYAEGGFASIYLAYYDGLGSSLWTYYFPALFIHLPTFIVAAAFSSRVSKADTVTHDALRQALLIAAPVLAGFVALYFLSDASLWQVSARIFGGLLLLLGAWQLIRVFRPEMPHMVAGAVMVGLALFASLQSAIGFYGFLDPTRFRVSAEENTAAGLMTLLQSRDYDDPFYALLWQQKTSLTQSSRTVQSGLYRMGHLPMLMGPIKARVLMLGLGSTVSLHGILMHEPSHVDCVEPFGPAILLAKSTKKDKRPKPWMESVDFHAERIESFVRRDDGEYDVIVSAEPFAAPGISAALLTEETIRETADLLATDGVYAQWLPVSRVGVEGVRAVAAAMGSVFPRIELWISGPDPENAMAGIFAYKNDVAGSVPAPERLAALAKSPEIAFHFRQIEIDAWPSLATAWAMDDATIRRFSSGADGPGLFSPLPLRNAEDDPSRVWTDARALLAARSAPRSMHAAVPDSVFAIVEQQFPERLSIFDARVLALQDNDKDAVTMLGNLLKLSPRNSEARRAFADIMLRQAANYVGQQEYPSAFQLLNTAMALVPLNTYLLRLLMISALQTGDRESAGLAIDGLKKLDPLHAGFRDNQATIRAQQGSTNDALLLYENAITIDPLNEEFYCNMASFHFSQDRVWEAVRVLDQATDRAYYPAKALYLQGMFYAEQGRQDFARKSWEKYQSVATPIDPMLAEVEHRLATIPEKN